MNKIKKNENTVKNIEPLTNYPNEFPELEI